MKTSNTNKLAFTKNALVELNDSQMIDVQGGTSPLMPSSIITVMTILEKEMEASN